MYIPVIILIEYVWHIYVIVLQTIATTWIKTEWRLDAIMHTLRSKKQNQKINPLSLTLGFLIYWFIVIRDAVISANLFQNQSHCWIIVKRNKTVYCFYVSPLKMFSQSLWETNLIVMRRWNDSLVSLFIWDWSYILSDVQYWKWRRTWY